MRKALKDSNDIKETDEKWMRAAIAQAKLASDAGEVPVGAVIVFNGELLSSAYNNPVSSSDPSAHAEILAIRKAAAILKNYRLGGTTLYVTLEPCLMCTGAIIQARIARLVFGASDPKNGAAESLYHIFDDNRLNHAVIVQGGVLREECGEILSGFFRRKRLTFPA
jgi:tRNA(adenine34) deaminase